MESTPAKYAELVEEVRKQVSEKVRSGALAGNEFEKFADFLNHLVVNMPNVYRLFRM